MEIQLIQRRACLALLSALLCFAPLTASASVYLATPNINALSSGLVGYWPLDGETTNWSTGFSSDVSGNGNNGILTGMSTTTTPVIGKMGGALTTGITSYVSATSNNFPIGGSARTISAWIKPTTLTSSEADFFQYGSKSSGLANIIGIISFHPFYSAWIGDLECNSITVSAGTWSFITFTNTSASTGTLYYNGVPCASGSVGNTINTASAAPACFGNVCGDTSRYMTGAVDDVRVYNRALSAQEIQMLYEMGTFNLGNTPTVNSPFSIAQGGTQFRPRRLLAA